MAVNGISISEFAKIANVKVYAVYHQLDLMPGGKEGNTIKAKNSNNQKVFCIRNDRILPMCEKLDLDPDSLKRVEEWLKINHIEPSEEPEIVDAKPSDDPHPAYDPDGNQQFHDPKEAAEVISTTMKNFSDVQLANSINSATNYFIDTIRARDQELQEIREKRDKNYEDLIDALRAINELKDQNSAQADQLRLNQSELQASASKLKEFDENKRKLESLSMEASKLRGEKDTLSSQLRNAVSQQRAAESANAAQLTERNLEIEKLKARIEELENEPVGFLGLFRRKKKRADE